MFTHLHVHSDNSVLDGYGTIDEYINKAKEYNQNALALTDHNTLTGIYTFINKCRKQGIKGIAGCEINLAPNNNAKLKEYIQYGNNKYVLNNGVNTHLTLLAKNHNGLLNLFQIIYYSYKSENFFNVPRIDLNILKQFSKDLICLSGCPNSEINIRLRMNDIEKAENEALQLKEIFGQDFYIEIMSMRGEPNYNIEKLIDLALKLKIQPVLTNDIHYANKSDSNIHEKILAIGRKAKMEETPTTMGGLRYKFADNEYYFKNEDEMKNSLFNRLKQTRFDDKTIQIIINSCIKNTQVISDKIEEIKFEYNPTLRNKPFLPKEFTSSFDYLKYLVKQGFEKKRRNSSDEVKAISLQKQEEELETIYANDFVDYFIVVKDYIDWTRANGGGVGVGRGCFLPDNTVYIKSNRRIKIQDIPVGIKTKTHDTTMHTIEKLWEYNVNNELCVEIELSNGEKISATHDHKIFKKDVGFTPIIDLEVGEVLLGPHFNNRNKITFSNKIENINNKNIFHSERVNRDIKFNSLCELKYLNILETSSNVKDFKRYNTTINEDKYYSPDFIIEMNNKEIIVVKIKDDLKEEKNIYKATKEYFNKKNIQFKIISKQDIEENDLKYNNITIISKKVFNYTGKVYDLKVEGVMNYVIAGVTVHNSVGGSEIAYLLDISRTDPIRFGLMFERFISPGRGATFRICYNDNTQEDINIANKKTTNHGEKYIYQLNQGDIVIEDTEKVITEITIIDAGSSPDIDTDFQTNIREKTIEYVSQKYGVQNSSHLITHGKFGVKNAFRSLCQIYSDIPSTKVNEISKMLPDLKEDEEDDLKNITLADYIEENGRLYNKGTAIRLAIDTPRLKEIAIETDKLIGRKRDTGVHACGVVMSQNPLIENIPLQIKHDKNSDMTITQWTYQECEELGIIKMDFLGLDTIDLMENTVKLIKKTKNIDINLEEIIYDKLDDEEVFKLFQDGNTFGIFQFGEEGVRELLRSVHPTEFEELAAITALYRPGPMGMNLHTEFAKRKNDINSRIPVHPSFKNTDLEKILNSTFGACTYQEQIMQISKVCAGFSPKDADGLRKAMGKKKIEVLNKYETQFKQGMNEHGYTDTNAVNILWDGMVGFAKYAFNKSHAISYALNSYTCAYLKVHYPTEFMSVLLQQKFGDDDISKYLNETKRLGIEIIPPNINTSMLVMTPVEDYKISYGLKCIKSLSDKDIENIYYEREKNGKYKDIIDFIQRNNISGTMLKTLSMAGCLDCFGITRKGIYEECNDIVKKAEKLKKDKNINFLFNFIDNNNIVTKNYKEWCNSEKIRNEAIATGLYISGNPVDNITLKSGRVIENQTELDKIDCDCTQLVTITMKPIIKKNKKGQNYFMLQLNNGTSEIKEFVKGNIINRIMLYNALSKITDYTSEQDHREKAYQKLNLNEESKVVFNQIKPLENLQVYKVYKATYKTYKTGDIVRKSLEDLEPLLISENNRELKEIYFNGDSSKIEKLIAFLKKESLKYNKSDLSDIILYDNKLNSIVVNDVIINGSIFQISKGKLSDKPF